MDTIHLIEYDKPRIIRNNGEFLGEIQCQLLYPQCENMQNKRPLRLSEACGLKMSETNVMIRQHLVYA